MTADLTSRDESNIKSLFRWVSISSVFVIIASPRVRILIRPRVRRGKSHIFKFWNTFYFSLSTPLSGQSHCLLSLRVFCLILCRRSRRLHHVLQIYLAYPSCRIVVNYFPGRACKRCSRPHCRGFRRDIERESSRARVILRSLGTLMLVICANNSADIARHWRLNTKKPLLI